MTMNARRIVILLAVVVLGGGRPAVGEGFSWRKYAEKPAEWYRGEEGRKVTARILSNQSTAGSWPKNFDTSAIPDAGDRTKIVGTFDNGATFGELRFLARAFQATGDAVDRDAFLRGLDLTMKAQYPNGGFPQHYPTSQKGYDRRITFNDGTMVNILQFLRDIARSDDFAFIDPDRRVAADRAFDRGIACILACQIKVDGELTAWCAQHDENTLVPAGARAFELASISGGESAGILQLLMSLPDPSPEVVRAIEAGVRWYDSARLTGVREELRQGDKIIIRDPEASPLWARFYEIETNRPFFCGRDGVKKYDVSEIEAERRNGYAWYGAWGEAVARRHAAWKAQRKKAA